MVDWGAMGAAQSQRSRSSGFLLPPHASSGLKRCLYSGKGASSTHPSPSRGALRHLHWCGAAQNHERSVLRCYQYSVRVLTWSAPSGQDVEQLRCIDAESDSELQQALVEIDIRFARRTRLFNYCDECILQCRHKQVTSTGPRALNTWSRG